MKKVLLLVVLLTSSATVSAMDYKPVIQSLMGDVCSSSPNVSVCMYQFSAAVKAGKSVGENAEFCKGKPAGDRETLDCNTVESSADYIDSLFDTNRKAVESAK